MAFLLLSKIRKNNKGQVAVEFILMMALLAAIIYPVLDQVNKNFIQGPNGIQARISKDILCIIRYGYSCGELGITPGDTKLSDFTEEPPIDTGGTTTGGQRHPLKRVFATW